VSVLYTSMGGVAKSSCIGTRVMGRVAAGVVVQIVIGSEACEKGLAMVGILRIRVRWKSSCRGGMARLGLR
jgi:hypothetical protein